MRGKVGMCTANPVLGSPFSGGEKCRSAESLEVATGQVDGDISTPEAKQCILEQQQKELEACHMLVNWMDWVDLGLWKGTTRIST